jgi:hypothetical protein
MKQRVFLLILMGFLFLSCIHEKFDSSVDVLTFDYKSKSVIKLSEFIRDITIIPLETSNISIIGNISKVQLFGDKVYILDDLSNSLFMYDTSGKFVDKIDKAGQGPGEYIRILDFIVNENGIYLLDLSSHKINHYGLDLSFVDEIRFQTIGSALMADHTNFWLYNEPTFLAEDYRLTQIDIKGNTAIKLFPRNCLPGHSYSMASSNVFQRNGGSLFFSPRYENAIYELNGNECSLRMKLSFKNKTFLEDRDIADEDIYKGEYLFRQNFYILDGYIIVDYLVDNQRYFSFYNKQTHKSISGSVIKDVIPDYDRFFPRWSNDNCLIESVEAEYVINDFTGLSKAASLQDLHPDDNPILVLYTFN